MPYSHLFGFKEPEDQVHFKDLEKLEKELEDAREALWALIFSLLLSGIILLLILAFTWDSIGSLAKTVQGLKSELDTLKGLKEGFSKGVEFARGAAPN